MRFPWAANGGTPSTTWYRVVVVAPPVHRYRHTYAFHSTFISTTSFAYLFLLLFYGIFIFCWYFFYVCGGRWRSQRKGKKNVEYTISYCQWPQHCAGSRASVLGCACVVVGFCCCASLHVILLFSIPKPTLFCGICMRCVPTKCLSVCLKYNNNNNNNVLQCELWFIQSYFELLQFLDVVVNDIISSSFFLSHSHNIIFFFIFFLSSSSFVTLRCNYFVVVGSLKLLCFLFLFSFSPFGFSSTTYIFLSFIFRLLFFLSSHFVR